jgi:hypothetical protein
MKRLPPHLIRRIRDATTRFMPTRKTYSPEKTKGWVINIQARQR